MFRFDRHAEVSLKETRGGHLQSSTALQLEAALCLFTGKLLGTKTKQINLGFFIFKEADMPGEVVADLGLILIQYLVQNSTKPKTTPDVNLATFPFQAVSLPTSGPLPSQLILLHRATKVLVQTANSNFCFISTCLHIRSSPVRSLLPAVKMSSKHCLCSLLVKSEMV